MKALSIQVQPGRFAATDVPAIEAQFSRIAEHTELVERHTFDRGHDRGEYLNFTFGTNDLRALWNLIQQEVYRDPLLASSMAAASMAVCEGEHGWDDYLLLYHFDSAVKTDVLVD